MKIWEQDYSRKQKKTSHISILILVKETIYCTIEKERSKKSQEDKKEDENVLGNLFKKWEQTHMLKDRHSYSNQKKVCINHCEIRRGNKIDTVGKERYYLSVNDWFAYLGKKI